MYRSNLVNIIKILIVLFSSRKKIVASDQFCIFPPEIQGEFRIQNAAINGNKVIQYSKINITNDDILPYGSCYSRNGSNFIVVLGNDDDRIACYRCFNLQMVSKNVLLLIHTESDINSKCSSSPETVKCPIEISSNDEKKFTNDFYSIILFRIESRPNEICPFDGKMKFDYYLDNRTRCSGLQSTISNCPSSSSLNIAFKNCTQDLHPLKYDCLANWRMQNQNYLVMTESSNIYDDTETKYKCGTYEVENESKITLKLNSDCNSLTKSNSHHENQQIFKIQTSLDFYDASTANGFEISFPKNLQGEWQYMKILHNHLILKDPSSLKTFYMTLMSIPESDRYILKSRSQCGEEQYKCIYITHLHDNVIETQISSKTLSSLINYDICNAKYFDNRWTTQAKIGANVTKSSAQCPIYGKYFGRLPDDMELCSTISSDCHQPDIMVYRIGPCDSHDIYETRVYRCLGFWTDKKSSNVYTLTQRVDVVNTYECFVGLMTNSDSIFIREAGEEGNCYKSLDIFSFGMELNRTEKCPFDEEIIVNPTSNTNKSSTKYEYIDDITNYIELSTSTKKPKVPKKPKQHDDDNDIYTNIIPSSSSSSTEKSSSSSVMVAKNFYIFLLVFYLMLRR